jgi:uncharacterized protein YyaL (SSP411 family)
MMLKTRLLLLSVSLGLALSGGALAAPGNQKPVKKTNANPPKMGQGAQDKSACRALNSQAKELLAREKQLHEEAKAKEGEEKALIAQATQIERQRVAEEHSLRTVQNKGTEESRLKAQEQQRVNLEHQATEKSKEREALIKQADEVGKQRRDIEERHKQECQHGAGSKPVK